MGVGCDQTQFDSQPTAYTAAMEQARLEASFAREILNPTLDLAPEYAEMGIDALATSDVVKEVPLVKTAVALFKTGVAIREWHFVKKLLAFLKEFHSNSTESEGSRAFRDKINSDFVFRDKVASHLLVILDRYVTAERAQVLAHLFRAHVNGDIGWNDFVSLSEILDALHRSSYAFLEELAIGATPFFYHGGDRPEEAPLFAAGIATRHGTKFSVTPLGKLLYSYGMKPLSGRGAAPTTGS